MKITNSIIVIVGFLLFTQCKSKQAVQYFPSAELSYMQSEGDLLTIRVLGYGLSEQEAITDAQINGFENLFFRGIPNSPYNNALIGVDELSIKSKHETFFRNFYWDKNMLNFLNNYGLLSSDKTTVLAKKIKGRKTELNNIESIASYIEMTVNVKALRKHLESKQIIRAFGY